MTNNAEFWNRAAAKYAKQPISDEAAYERTLARSISYLAPEKSVLELGCGTVTTALRLAPHVLKIDGTDFSREMIAEAEERLAASGLENVTFRVASAEDALCEANAPDVIFAHSLLHLLETPEAQILRIYDALPSGGLFISKTPCLRDMGAVKGLAIAGLLPLLRLLGKAPDTVTSFSGAALERLIAAAGFDIVEALSAPAMSRYIVARKA